jgi:RimJ/RimL family protein N-acetyltransferase
MPKSVFIDIPEIGTCLTPDFNKAEIEFCEIDGAEHESWGISITTNRLKMFSLSHQQRTHKDPSDLNNLIALHDDPEVMDLYASGKPIPADNVRARYNERKARFSAHNPYSAYVIDDENGNFIGQVVLGFGPQTGKSEYAIVLAKKEWHKYYGTEATVAIAYNLAPQCIKEGYKINGSPLNAIVATAHPKNGTAVIFRNLNFDYTGTVIKEDDKLSREHHELPMTRAIEIYENTQMSM